MTPSEQLNAAKIFCNENLLQCCIEILEWKKTGLLQDGKVRELYGMLDFAGHSAMSLAEELIKTAAMEQFVATRH